MGGRGAYTENKQQAYIFKTINKIDDIKVLVPIDTSKSHNMPAEAHSSKAYIILDKKHGVFRQYREYNSGHLPTFEIGYHFESGLSENGHNVFHVHEYSNPGIEHRQKGRLMTPNEISQYRKFFKGVTQQEHNKKLMTIYHIIGGVPDERKNKQ